ncbi:MAG: ankyrin repeat domain-containing protein [Actinomycetota bacterium]
MVTLHTEEPLAVAVVEAIHRGDVPTLKRLLAENPDLVTTRLGDDDRCGMSRTLLHVATDWPGHFPNGAATVTALVEAGADVDARFRGPHSETPLHWAASSDDVEVLEVLIDAGADMEAEGAVIGGGTPLAEARGFGQWRAARRLVERGAKTTLTDSATLGLMERVESYFAGDAPPTQEEIDRAFWGACHGGQQRCAEYLLDKGADLNWVPPWEELTPLDAAERSHAGELVRWLRSRDGRAAVELGG